MNSNYIRVWKTTIFIYAHSIDEAKEMANYIDNMDSDSTYASVDPTKLEYDGRVKING